MALGYALLSGHVSTGVKRFLMDPKLLHIHLQFVHVALVEEFPPVFTIPLPKLYILFLANLFYLVRFLIFFSCIPQQLVSSDYFLFSLHP